MFLACKDGRKGLDVFLPEEGLFRVGSGEEMCLELLVTSTSGGTGRFWALTPFELPLLKRK